MHKPIVLLPLEERMTLNLPAINKHHWKRTNCNSWLIDYVCVIVIVPKCFHERKYFFFRFLSNHHLNPLSCNIFIRRSGPYETRLIFMKLVNKFSRNAFKNWLSIPMTINFFPMCKECSVSTHSINEMIFHTPSRYSHICLLTSKVNYCIGSISPIF